MKPSPKCRLANEPKRKSRFSILASNGQTYHDFLVEWNDIDLELLVDYGNQQLSGKWHFILALNVS